MSLTEDIMRGKGYLRQADGSFSRPDSHGVKVIPTKLVTDTHKKL